MTALTLIVAATRANGIGKGGTLPWRLRKEMAYFARVTTHAPEGEANAVIMGRNTWESIPPKFRPLRRRTNVVVSRNASYELSQADGAPAHLRASVQDAMQHLARAEQPVHRAFLIGGAALYAECLALPAGVPGAVERVLLTRVLAPAFDDCDVFMPDFAGSGAWRRAEHAELARWVGGDVPEGVQEENGVEYEFQMWVREQESRGDA